MAIHENDETRKWLIPAARFVLIKRFSSKEEKRRLVSGVLDPADFPSGLVGIENHLNFFHRKRSRTIHPARPRPQPFPQLDRRRPLLPPVQRPHPSQRLRPPLIPLSRHHRSGTTRKSHLGRHPTKRHRPCHDRTSRRTLVHRFMSPSSSTRVSQALELLQMIGIPREQQNERSALTLLALADIKPRKPWKSAISSSPPDH